MKNQNPYFFELPPEAYDGKLPFVLEDLINRLQELHAEKIEGIFRLNGSDTQIRALIADLNKERITDWSKYPDIHTIATTLKRYFGKMASHEPIIPFDFYQPIIQVIGSEDDSDSSKVSFLHGIINSISYSRQITLAYLIQFLKTIANNSDVNKMTPSNIGICFGPNLIQTEGSAKMSDSAAINGATALMIQYYDQVFDGIVIDESIFCNDEDIAILTRPAPNLMHIQHQIFRCQFRLNHKIPYIPLCNLISSGTFSRPQRSPPAKPKDENESEELLFTTICKRVKDNINQTFCTEVKRRQTVSSFSLDLPELPLAPSAADTNSLLSLMGDDIPDNQFIPEASSDI